MWESAVKNLMSIGLVIPEKLERMLPENDDF